MEPNDPKAPPVNPQESNVEPVSTTKDPKKVAGSINPKQKNVFYDSFVQKADKRKKR